MKILFRLAALAVIVFILSVSLISAFSQPVNTNDTRKREILVAAGQSLDQIANDLSQAGLIRSRAVFKIALYRYNLNQKIQAGYFYLSPSQSTTQIAQALTHATAKQVWITIPEGLRREEIANLILDKLVEAKATHKFDPEEFIKSTKDLEGHLFPETYAFAPSSTTEDVTNRLTAQFNKVVEQLEVLPGDVNRVLTIASLVEREAGQDSERIEIASIITKRAAANWGLQIDATVQYAVANSKCRIRICDWWPKNLSKEDLAIISPYNTYKNIGLPPGPIDNPGRASLTAAAHPVSTKNWFYLHDASGQIHYATTIEEHNRNVCTFLKKSC